MNIYNIADALLQDIFNIEDRLEAIRYVQVKLRIFKRLGVINDIAIAEICTAMSKKDKRFKRMIVEYDLLDKKTIDSLVAECAICLGRTTLTDAIQRGRWTFNEPLDCLKIVVDEGIFKVFGVCNNC